MTDEIAFHVLIVRLPEAPSLKIYCLYGHGKETEVGEQVEGSLISAIVLVHARRI